MYKRISFVVLPFFLIVLSCTPQQQPVVDGEWIGFLPNKKSFNFQVTLEHLDGAKYQLTLVNDTKLIDETFESSSADHIRFNKDEQLFFNLEKNSEGTALSGFIKTGKFYYRVRFPKIAKNTFGGPWNPFMVDNGLQSDDIMLYVEHMEDSTLAAYPFWGDQRFRGMWSGDFEKKGETLFFRDGMTGLNFQALFLPDTIELKVFLTDVLLAKTNLTHTTEGWDYNRDAVDQSQDNATPPQTNDGWATANSDDSGIDTSELARLVTDIHANTLVNTHSVLIAKEGKLVYENYFEGFNAHIPHDLRSASKSISSAIIGIAMDDGILESVDQKLYDFLPESYQATKDELKSKIRLKHLLTMSSGLEVNGKASEDNYQSTTTTPWLQTVLEAPMVKEPGTYADYGSANPFLLGICLNEVLDVPLEDYMDEKLFAPLGITNYINQTDDTYDIPYFGGGMLLTPRDLLKFGQLYLNKGQWQGRQVISEQWVEASFQKHLRLQDVQDKNAYGYLWWHDSYEVKGKEFRSIEARGAGGQFIFILPELESVVVITAGNFRNRKGNQSREVLRDYILPALVP